MELDKLAVKSDDRGSLVEVFKMPNDGQIFYIMVKPGEMRGGHYHTRKTERFLVMYGSAVIEVKDRESGDVIKVTVTGQKPMTITVVPNHTHTLTATDEGAIILAWVDELFNKEDPDTYPEEI